MSIGTVARDFAGTSVEAVNGSVRSLLGGRYVLKTFGLVYAAGLYDYLPDTVAVKLKRKCVNMLKPGGSFLFGNFSQETDVDGYMETFMNWPLLLRTQEEMWTIARESIGDTDVNVSVWFGANRNILYCEIENSRSDFVPQKRLPYVGKAHKLRSIRRVPSKSRSRLKAPFELRGPCSTTTKVERTFPSKKARVLSAISFRSGGP